MELATNSQIKSRWEIIAYNTNSKLDQWYKPALRFEITKSPMSILEVYLDKGQGIRAEGGSLVYMIGDIEIDIRMRQGGFLKNLKVATLGGELFFVNDFIAKEDGCSIGLTGRPIGDMSQIPVSDGNGFIIQSNVFTAWLNENRDQKSA